MIWKIKCYVSPTGRCDVQLAYDAGNDALKAAFEVALGYLTPLPRDKWIRPHAAKLDKQKFRDFFEIRFKANNLQQRPVGFFGPQDDEFTIVMWLTEKGGRLIPTDWFESADRRRKEVIDGNASTQDMNLQGEDNE